MTDKLPTWLDALTRLIEEWREPTTYRDDPTGDGARLRQKCADQLETALADVQQALEAQAGKVDPLLAPMPDENRPVCSTFNSHPVSIFVCATCWHPMDAHQKTSEPADSLTPTAAELFARISGLLQRWHRDVEKPSLGTDYDTGQYDALMVCISELHAALTSKPELKGVP